MAPLLSVVIANYNYGRFLEEAIQSIIAQGIGDQVELIVCDAASTDNSVEVIKRYEKYIAWWCSEKDGGQSAAFNKGFSHAHGRFLTWLNADDVMLPGTVRALAGAAERWPEYEWFVGGCFWLDPQMHILKCFRARSFSEIRFSTGQVSSWGPSSFFTKRLLDSVGGVDERCQYTMDGDLWLKFAAVARVRYKPFVNYAWGLRLHENGKMSGHNFEGSGHQSPDHPKWAQIKREGELRKEYFTPTAKRTRWNWFRSIRWVPVIASRLDTFRYSGKHYSCAYK